MVLVMQKPASSETNQQAQACLASLLLTLTAGIPECLEYLAPARTAYAWMTSPWHQSQASGRHCAPVKPSCCWKMLGPVSRQVSIQ